MEKDETVKRSTKCECSSARGKLTVPGVVVVAVVVVGPGVAVVNSRTALSMSTEQYRSDTRSSHRIDRPRMLIVEERT